jgi:hypothetical protein
LFPIPTKVSCETMRLRKPRTYRKEECSKCGKPKEQNRIFQHGYCLSCFNTRQREIRTRHSDLPEDQRKRANARSYLHVYIRRGKIVKGTCEVCQSVKVEAHHEDYTKPLQVRWLCRTHHMELHYGKE